MNTKQITVDGTIVTLFERTAKQTQELTTLLGKMEQEASPDNVVLFYGSIAMLLQSLTKNIKTTKLSQSVHKFFRTKTYKWNSIFTADYLVEHVTLKELYTYCAMIQQLEGSDNTFYRLLSKDISEEEARKLIEANKKKVAGSSQSAEK